ARLSGRELGGLAGLGWAPADAERGGALDDTDGVRADVLAAPPCEQEVAPQLLARLAARDLHPLAVLDVPVAVLDEQAAEHALEVALAARESAPLLVAQDPDRLLPLERLERRVVVVGREQDVDEALGERPADPAPDRAAE